MNHNLIDILLVLFGTGSIIIGAIMMYRANKQKKDNEAWLNFQPSYTVEEFGVETLSMSFLARSVDGIKMYGPSIDPNGHTVIDAGHLEWIKKDYSVKLAKKMLEDGFVKVEVEEMNPNDKRLTMTVKLLRPKHPKNDVAS